MNAQTIALTREQVQPTNLGDHLAAIAQNGARSFGHGLEPRVDREEMRRFFEAAFKNCPRRGFLCLRGFPHGDDIRLVTTEWIAFDGAFNAAVAEAEDVGKRRAPGAVFAPPVCVFRGELDQTGRRRAREQDVAFCPVILVECDERPVEALETLTKVLGRPTMAVESGGVWQGPHGPERKLHLYWRLSSPAATPHELALLKSARRLAATLVSADQTAVTVVHPIRWPGSLHTKDPAAPKLCRIVAAEDREVDLHWAEAELRHAVEVAGLVVDVARAAEARAGFKHPEPLPRIQLMSLAEAIPNSRGWDDWSNIGMAFFDASHGSLDGLEAYERWSERWESNRARCADDVDVKWEHMRRYPPTSISAGSLLHRAKLANPSFVLPVDAERFLEEPGIPCEAFVPDAALFGPATDDVFPTLSIDDLLEAKPPEYLIDGLVPEHAVGFLYGAPGSFKTFLALDMALSVACGLPSFHGKAIRADAGLPVLYIAAEGSFGLGDRVAAWLRQQGRQAPPATFRAVPVVVDFTKPEQVEKLMRTVRLHWKGSRGLVVLDTVSRALPGADENLQKEMTGFVNSLGRISAEFRCAVMGLHHANAEGSHMRGSTVLQGAGDFVFRMKRRGSGDDRRVSLTVEKQKDAPDGWSMPFNLIAVATREGRSSLVPLTYEDPVADAGQASLQQAVEVIAKAYDSGAALRKKTRAVNGGKAAATAADVLMTSLGIGRADADQLIDEVVRLGFVENVQNPGKKTLELRPMSGWRDKLSVRGVETASEDGVFS